ncbi:IclR family transcriptional regulator [Enemella evansiae]|uniref:IclR family transcriptional regulator n=1 Tax=Enemella evansiae TaxID=2016499 RepID=UPI000B9797FE|nr:IclR family transcriptional regulator [Enemella evansiae]OYO19538.1 IclR family transcriptional regulator [Enemella evansiae]TDO91416.1 IclR family transcriptional regulator [Enemella evansiae]
MAGSGPRPDEEPPPSVIGRVVRILAVFSPEVPRLTVTEIARRTGLPLPSASRLVGQLVTEGLLERTGQGIQLGLRMWELAARAQPVLDLRDTALPFMQVLHAGVGQHTQLGILDGVEVIFLERLAAPGAAVNYSRIAGRMPLHQSSSGLVLLAHAEVDLLDRVLSGPLPAATANTVVHPDRLRALLAHIRRIGYAYTPGFVHPDTAGLAVPLRRGRRVVAALSLIVPNNERARDHLAALQECARQVSLALGSERRPRLGG